MLFGGLVTIKRLLDVLTTEVAVTNQRLNVKLGLLRRDTIEQQLSKIDSVSVSQSILGRILGYGTLQVRGTGVSNTSLPGIGSPLGFRKDIQSAIESALNNFGFGGQRK